MKSSGRSLVVGLLLLLTVAGLGLRCSEIDAFGLSPDDGNYLHSAGVPRMDSAPELTWIEQDRDWLERVKTYPHSYLHQYAIRWLKRAGADNVASVRLGSAILGGLTPWLLYLLFAGRDEKHRRTGLLAAAMLAGYTMHVWYSRTGWGQIGCTFFFVTYLLCADRLFHSAGPRSRGKTALWALGMLFSSLAAYGYHEMIVVHIAGMGLYAILHLYWNRGTKGSAQRVERLLAFGLSCIPVAAWATTLLNDSFAQQHWTGLVQEEYGRSYWGWRVWILEKMYKNYGLHEQLGWIVLPLAIPGMWFLAKRDRQLFRFLFTMFMVSWSAFFFAFRDPYLVRIYLPTFVLLVAFAAEGALGIVDRVRPQLRRVAQAVVVALVLVLWAQSFCTVFVERDTPLTISSFYTPNRTPHRNSLGPICDYLHEHRKDGQILGVSADRSPRFWLQDEGISSRPHNGRAWNKPPAEQPMWIICGQAQMAEAKRTVNSGGPYELIITDTTERLGLYKRLGQ